MLEHRERGCGMKGPKNRTDVETDLLEEAALLLTSNGCPGDLMQHFGFSTVSILRTLSNLNTLTSRGLPCPVLACIFSRGDGGQYWIDRLIVGRAHTKQEANGNVF